MIERRLLRDGVDRVNMEKAVRCFERGEQVLLVLHKSTSVELPLDGTRWRRLYATQTFILRKHHLGMLTIMSNAQDLRAAEFRGLVFDKIVGIHLLNANNRKRARERLTGG